MLFKKWSQPLKKPLKTPVESSLNIDHVSGSAADLRGLYGNCYRCFVFSSIEADISCKRSLLLQESLQRSDTGLFFHGILRDVSEYQQGFFFFTWRLWEAATPLQGDQLEANLCPWKQWKTNCKPEGTESMFHH